jgi:hypothetical protein
MYKKQFIVELKSHLTMSNDDTHNLTLANNVNNVNPLTIRFLNGYNTSLNIINKLNYQYYI